MKVVIACAFGQLIEKVWCNSYAKFSKWGFVAENLNDVSSYNSIIYIDVREYKIGWLIFSNSSRFNIILKKK